jgi:N-glycosylase/DNA lyase
MKDVLPIPVPRPQTNEAPPLNALIAHYNKIKPVLKRRIAEFRSVIERGSDHSIFSELCFCILTANASAIKCDQAIRELRSLNLLNDGSACRIRPKLRARARFHNKKAGYIVKARELLRRGTRIDVKGRLDPDDIIKTRDLLVDNIKGYGYKEASHFLRNVGLGADIAILDRHILKNLKRYGVIDKIPASISSRKIYIGIEDRMRSFSKHIGIPMGELDLLFWSIETGYIFK